MTARPPRGVNPLLNHNDESKSQSTTKLHTRKFVAYYNHSRECEFDTPYLLELNLVGTTHVTRDCRNTSHTVNPTLSLQTPYSGWLPAHSLSPPPSGSSVCRFS